ncbi:MAG: TIGR00282 family metallophosphoesterase [Alphaproteobacteria bacterium]|nr:TIGR00282 family metallophosphoesterase [Alphaproteobacteria bacterium]
MRIVFIGDIMGRSGREALEKYLPEIRENLEPDVVIVNGENSSNGAGITEKICKQYYEWGVDCITTGNHVWDQREIIPYIGRDPRLLRPINFPPGTPGSGLYKHRIADGRTVSIVNAMGRLFMDSLDDPFRSLVEMLAQERLGETTGAIFVDFHAETTSEKMSLAHYLDGRVSAVVGTHTHIPTADAHVLSKGTAYLTDAGMTGDYDSVIGVEKEIAMHRFIKKMPGERMRPASGAGTLCGCLVVTNDKTGLAHSIEPIRLGGCLPRVMPGAAG